MAYPSEHYGFSNGALRVVLVLVAMFFVVYIFGLGLFSKGSSNDAQASCSCDCNCSENLSTTHILVSPPLLLSLLMWQHDPEISEEMKKGVADLISEEIGLQKRVANETLEQTWNSVIAARRVSLQYETEAQKCSAHTEACEAGRERAEAGLVEERKLTAMWEQRALELGWTENIT
ncbi:Importin [Salix suchowensis]|nr:Importin [Salix suchowensis]